jgi:hypothetical protein
MELLKILRKSTRYSTETDDDKALAWPRKPLAALDELTN